MCFMLMLEIFPTTKNTYKHSVSFAWPLVCRHSERKPRKHLKAVKALSSLVIKMFCWSFMVKTSQSSPQSFVPKLLLAKELHCLHSLTFSEGATFKWTSSAISGGMLE